ncbi:MAG TPA: glycoside hydrolase family 57 protein [Sunxiuqinia sp.]|nr:glycoside hydrolase family 57 protein [Sunxiuqinia sp.]
MKTICLYFQVHQPLRYRQFRFFDIGNNEYYYDDYSNETILKRVANNCYLPTNKMLLDQIKKYKGEFKVAFSISGVALDQFHLYAPEVIHSFQELVQTGCVEFIAETYSHSLAAIADTEEFKKQVESHAEQIERLFGQRPKVFRNTELIYSNEIGTIVSELGFDAILAEGVNPIFGPNHPGFVYKNTLDSNLKVLLRNFPLSDDIAFRFSDESWSEWPLTTKKYISWLNRGNQDNELINLFMDYETFGEHQKNDTGINDFLKSFASNVLHNSQFKFMTPSEVVANKQPVDVLDAPHPSSWADCEKDLSAWLGNEIQQEAFRKLYDLSEKISHCDDRKLLKDWQYLQTSDHFYYMSTKSLSDGEVHADFNPYDSPFDAFINYMNVLNDFKIRLDRSIIQKKKAMLNWRKKERAYTLS